ncbi:hypothetical protein L2E82_29726 [Cichorium intybus]|uniref:Uncharacterized protein n=1 Tax=Cichorium intybus TaxID=13427 RepID=A0ACB9CYS6_CICIN|nr:hypothetical protein L2E82_29726 [Cichorium intybus]
MRDYQSDEDAEGGEDHDMMIPTPPCSAARGMSGVDGSNVADSHPSSLPVISRNGQTFASHDVHTKMTDLFLQCVEDCWMTVKEVPEVVLRKVFELLRTLYQWDPREEEAIFVGFKNVIKNRYRCRLRKCRKKSLQMARDSGRAVGEINDSFGILREFRPRDIAEPVWHQMCAHWDTEKWKKKSATGKKNRSSTDESGVISSHTGGSIGTAEHRDRLEVKLGRKPSWLDVYVQTHATAETKDRYINKGERDNLEFTSKSFQEAYDFYVECLAENRNKRS